MQKPETVASEDRVLTHHRQAASMWGQGGRSYDDVSFGLSDALAHAAQRLNARADEEILDVATGTGWSARNVARSGARVTAIDISADLLSAAKELSAHVRPPLAFQLGDVERLPFPDARFDGVISTFGVIFAQDQQQAARELGRIVRKGGRLALSTWAPDGSVAKFLTVIGKHSGSPPATAITAGVGRSTACRGTSRARFRAHIRARREQRLSPKHRAYLGKVCARVWADAAAHR